MHPPFLTLRRFYLFRKITIRFIFRTEYCNEDYTYDDSEEDDGDDGWAKAREMLEEEVVTSLGTEWFFYSTFLGACQIW